MIIPINMLRILVGVFCAFLWITPLIAANDTDFLTDEQRLIDKLFKNTYDPSLRPVVNHTDTIQLHLSLNPVSLLEVHEGQETATFLVWLKKSWKDFLIKWNPEDFGGITEIRVPAERLWVPDITAYQMPVSDYGLKPMVVVMSSGDVIWVPVHTAKFVCEIDAHYYPADELTCSITYGSWVYNGLQVHLKPPASGSTDIDLSLMKRPTAFHVIEAYAKYNSKKYECCEETYMDMEVTIKMRRISLRIFSMLVGPAVILGLLCPLMFILPTEGSQRFILGGTSLVCLTLLMLILGERVPPSTEPPIIIRYFIGLFVLVSLSMALSALTSNLANRSRPLPSILKMVSGCLAKPFCVKVNNPYDRVMHPRNMDDSDEIIRPKLGDTNHSDWQVLATVLDRLFFLLIFIFVLILSVAILPKISTFK